MKRIYVVVLISLFIASGCSTFFSETKPKPKKKKLPVKVVETIEQQPAVVNTVGEAPVVETTETTKKTKKTKNKANPALKPEPFSVDSGQEDPEVLGGQGTLKEKLEKLKSKKSDSNSTKKM